MGVLRQGLKLKIMRHAFAKLTLFMEPSKKEGKLPKCAIRSQRKRKTTKRQKHARVPLKEKASAEGHGFGEGQRQPQHLTATHQGVSPRR